MLELHKRSIDEVILTCSRETSLAATGEACDRVAEFLLGMNGKWSVLLSLAPRPYSTDVRYGTFNPAVRSPVKRALSAPGRLDCRLDNA